MAFIGNNVQVQGFTPAVDYFSGNGSTVTFTLSRPVVSVAQMIVSVANVVQNPSSAYTVSGSAITFTSAPPSGTNNIWVEYTSLITTYAAISQSPSVIGDITASGGYLATGNFNNSFIDGTIVDYVTGNGRITAGPADGITLYNGGTSARTALMALDASGNMGVGTAAPTGAKVHVVDNTSQTNTTLKLSNIAGAYTQSNVGFYTTAQTTSTEVLTARIYATYTASGYGNQQLVLQTGDGAGNLQNRLLINANGYVTTPYQPAFFAYGGNNTSGNIIVPNNVVLNIGSCYNSANGVFTAPIAGSYMFVGEVSTADGNNLYYNFYLNGAAQGQSALCYGVTYQSATQTIILNLAANDQVTLRKNNFNIYGCNLTGFLLG